jgi:hypothetical protein
MSLKTDPNDPRLKRYSGEEKPAPQGEVYLVRPDEEIKKGFVRPVRRTYVHDKCGVATKMGLKLSKKYAREPKFYGATYCVGCSAHFPVSQFKWEDGKTVGS